MLTWGAILVLALAMAGLIRQVRFLTSALRDRGRSSFAPPGASVQIGDAPPVLHDLVGGTNRDTVLLFASGDCGGCSERLADLDSLSGTEGPSLVAVYSGTGNGFRSPRVRTVENRYDLFSELGITMTPFGVWVDAQGAISDARPLGSQAAVKQLLEAGSGGSSR
jgi:hypothetical protein